MPTKIEIKTSHGQSFNVELETYDPATLAAQINDRTDGKQMMTIGNVVLNRNMIMSVAPVEVEAATQ